MRAILFILAFCAALPALAVQPDEILPDPDQEARARAISKELRCLVCRNESIDDSHATLARDLRLLVRERITAGDTDAETIDYIVDRYGEFVLLNPRFNAGNLVIWLAGPILLIAGGAVAWVFMRRQAPVQTAATALTPEEEARLKELTRD